MEENEEKVSNIKWIIFLILLIGVLVYTIVVKLTYKPDLTNVYEIIKKCLNPEANLSAETVTIAMNSVRFPEDNEEEEENIIKENLFDLPPPKPKSLPSCVLTMSKDEYDEYIEMIEDENKLKEMDFRAEPPTDENLDTNFDENMIPLYTNWLRLLTDEVEELQSEEIHIDQALGELDSTIDRISDLIHVGMIDIGLISNETE